MKRLLFGTLAIVSVIVTLATYLCVRHLVYWSPNEEVSFASGEIALAGTFVKPAEEGVYPSVILLHGSGPESRSDPTTRAVVNALVRNGFSVLVYDKRGVGASEGDFDSALYEDFIDDAIAAVKYVSDRRDVDNKRIGLYAVSESGWFAPEIAARTQSIAFIFNKVGPPLSWVDTVEWEVRNDYIAAGIAEADVQELVELARRRWNYYIAAAADSGYAIGPDRDEINRQITRLRSEIPGADQVLAEELEPYDLESFTALAADVSYDPSPFLSEIDIPMYYTYGGADINIPTQKCVAVLRSLIQDQQKEIDITVYPDVGHSLMTWKGLLNMGFVPGYLDTLTTWTAEKANIGN